MSAWRSRLDAVRHSMFLCLVLAAVASRSMATTQGAKLAMLGNNVSRVRLAHLDSQRGTDGCQDRFLRTYAHDGPSAAARHGDEQALLKHLAEHAALERSACTHVCHHVSERWVIAMFFLLDLVRVKSKQSTSWW